MQSVGSAAFDGKISVLHVFWSFAGVSTGSCRIVGFYEQSSCFVELIWSENNEINENTAEHTIDRKMLVCAHLAAIDDQLHTMG